MRMYEPAEGKLLIDIMDEWLELHEGWRFANQGYSDATLKLIKERRQAVTALRDKLAAEVK